MWTVGNSKRSILSDDHHYDHDYASSNWTQLGHLHLDPARNHLNVDHRNIALLPKYGDLARTASGLRRPAPPGLGGHRRECSSSRMDNGALDILSALAATHAQSQSPVLGGLPVRKRNERCDLLPWDDIRAFLAYLTDSSSQLQNGHPDRRSSTG